MSNLYIDSQQLIHYLQGEYEETHLRATAYYNSNSVKRLNEGMSLAYSNAKDFVLNKTKSGGVTIVRCKNCKYLRYDSDFQFGRYCALRNVDGGRFCENEDFCSYGELADDVKEGYN